jgi:hypothetical protein
VEWQVRISQRKLPNGADRLGEHRYASAGMGRARLVKPGKDLAPRGAD